MKRFHRRTYFYFGLLVFSILTFAYSWSKKQTEVDTYIPDLEEAVKSAMRTTKDEKPYVVMTMANYPYRDFTANLHCSLKATGDGRLLVVSLDEEMHAYAQKLGMSSAHFASLHSGLTGRLHRFGTPEFRVVTKRKLAAVRAVLATGVDVLFNDGDVAWCDNVPYEFADFATDQNVDIAAQRTKLGTDRINSGVYFVRHSARTIALFDEMLRRSEFVEKNDDQEMFNDIMCRKGTGGSEIWNGGGWREPEFCHWEHGNVKMGFMPEERYPIGCTKVEGKKLQQWNVKEVRSLCRTDTPKFALIHFSCWSIGSKHRAMNKMGLWRWNPKKQKCKS